MSTENPQNIMQSWNLQQSLRTGPTVDDRLAPPDFGKIRTQFISTWREQKLENNLMMQLYHVKRMMIFMRFMIFIEYCV